MVPNRAESGQGEHDNMNEQCGVKQNLWYKTIKSPEDTHMAKKLGTNMAENHREVDGASLSSAFQYKGLSSLDNGNKNR